MRLYERRGGTNASRRSSFPGYTDTMASAADQMAQSISLAKFSQATDLAAWKALTEHHDK